MNWVGVLVGFVVTVLAVWGLVEVVSAWLEVGRVKVTLCQCGRKHVIDDRPLFEGGTLLVHTADLCQPRREWVDD